MPLSDQGGFPVVHHELVARHVEDVEKQLLPALHGVQRALKSSTAAADKRLLAEVDEAYAEGPPTPEIFRRMP